MLVLVAGDAPISGARPQDVDQAAIAAGLGAATFAVTRDGGLAQVARLLAGAKRPPILASRGAHLAGAGPELRSRANG